MKLEPGKHHLGDEFDAFVKYQALKHLELTGAFGYFMPGELLPINNNPAKGAEWFAMQVLVTF
jgi:hypothetical protein